MVSMPSDIRIAIAEFEKAVDVSASRSIQLYTAEKAFEVVSASMDLNTYSPDEYGNAAQEVARTTINDIAAQFELMKKKKVLDVLVSVIGALPS